MGHSNIHDMPAYEDMRVLLGLFLEIEKTQSVSYSVFGIYVYLIHLYLRLFVLYPSTCNSFWSQGLSHSWVCTTSFTWIPPISQDSLLEKKIVLTPSRCEPQLHS